ncbi:hypothetical protein BJ508DRAFT_331922 [Ascobolus immersus RN42]|uniref:Uncharacterized protein n=1 Tax=Ascobolus immersus RN42 TaxID=1160509 RepID=A0A3N4HP61_ASCIM|nr:hypothetical protein BJ508DRAFT_331922 [Ascobolus immersus RN42]
MASFSSLPPELCLAIGKHITAWPDFAAFRQLDSRTYNLFSSRSNHIQNNQFAITDEDLDILSEFLFLMQLDDEVGRVFRRIISETVGATTSNLEPRFTSLRLDEEEKVRITTFHEWVMAKNILRLIEKIEQTATARAEDNSKEDIEFWKAPTALFQHMRRYKRRGRWDDDFEAYAEFRTRVCACHIEYRSMFSMMDIQSEMEGRRTMPLYFAKSVEYGVPYAQALLDSVAFKTKRSRRMEEAARRLAKLERVFAMVSRMLRYDEFLYQKGARRERRTWGRF